MSFGGKGGSQAATAPRVTGLKIQTSVLGRAVTLAYGTNRQAPWLIWYGDFSATQHAAASGGKGGGGKGGGGGGGKKGGGTGSYTYTASVEFGICYGPINGVGAVFTGKMVLTPAGQGITIINGTYPQAPWSHLASNHSFITQSNFVPISGPFTVTVAFNTGFQQDFGVSTPTAADGTPGIAFTKVASAPGINQYSVSNIGVYTFNSANGGIEVLISYQSAGQAPGDQALSYNGIAIAAQANLNLGGAPNLPNINLEVFAVGSLAQTVEARTVPSSTPFTVQGARTISIDTSVNDQTGKTSRVTIVYFVGVLSVKRANGTAMTQVSSAPAVGQFSVDSKGLFTFNSADGGTSVVLTYQYYGDADPSFVIQDILTNAHYGMGFPSNRIDTASFATYQAYVQATGLLISPIYDAQVSTQSALQEIAKVTNSEFVWSGALLKIIPYGDEVVSGNGYTYTPPSAPLFDLTDDDFMDNQGATGSSSSSNSDPVLLIRKRPADQINSVKVEFSNRDNMYNPEVVEAKDQAAIDLFTLRQAGASAQHLLTDSAAARLSAQLQLQRGLIRNVYQVTLDMRYMVLDGMDIVSLTEAALGMNKQWGRILEIIENNDGSFSMMVEEYLQGTGHSAQFSYQRSLGFAQNANQVPGSVNTPIIFEVPVQIADNNGLEIAAIVSGGSNYGGCDIWVSTDDQTYKVFGRMFGSSRQGVLVNPLALGGDPDTLNSIRVNLTESAGTMNSGTQLDADLGHTLCWVDGEFISYQNATLLSQYFYSLGTYLRRGQYGSMISTHAAGSLFGRIDGSEFRFAYDKSLIGTTIYIKFLAFNAIGGAQQTLSDVNPYIHVIQGPPRPPNVTGFVATQLGNAVKFGWNPIPLALDPALKGYDILYSPQTLSMLDAAGTGAISLTEAGRGTEMTNADVPAGTWRFWIRARDIADQISATPTSFDLTISSASSVPLINSEQDAVWPGLY